MTTTHEGWNTKTPLTPGGGYLGCAMMDPTILHRHRVPVTAMEPRYSELYKKIIERENEGRSIRSADLSMLFYREPWFPGSAHITDLEFFIASPTEAHGYAEKLNTAHKEKQLRAATALEARIDDPLCKIVEIESELARIVDDGNETLCCDIGSALKNYVSAGADVPRLETGESTIDASWVLDNGGLHVIAGRPGMGKTQFAVWLTAQVLDRGIPVMFFSAEMPTSQITARFVSVWRRGDVNVSPEFVMEQYSDKPLFVCDKAGMTLEDIILRSTIMKKKHNIGLVIVDYIQIVRLTERMRVREQEVAHITSSLKVLAKKLDLPVIALAQLNRGVEASGEKRPSLSHLRESGAIENDADSVSLLYRPEYYLRMENKEVPYEMDGLVELNIAKQRNAPACTMSAYWDRITGKWEHWKHAMWRTEQKVGYGGR